MLETDGSEMCWIVYFIFILKINFAFLTAEVRSSTTQANTAHTASAPNGSRVVAVLAPCVAGAAVIVAVVLAFMFVKIREKRLLEGSFSPRGLEQPDGGAQLRADDPSADLLLPVSLACAALLFLVLVTAAVVIGTRRRATRGTYSPSRQEKEGSRLEMWNIVQPPPMERLI